MDIQIRPCGGDWVRCDGEYVDECAEEMIVLLMSIYDYIGWKYAPEIKMLEYVAQLVKR